MRLAKINAALIIVFCAAHTPSFGQDVTAHGSNVCSRICNAHEVNSSDMTQRVTEASEQSVPAATAATKPVDEPAIAAATEIYNSKVTRKRIWPIQVGSSDQRVVKPDLIAGQTSPRLPAEPPLSAAVEQFDEGSSIRKRIWPRPNALNEPPVNAATEAFDRSETQTRRRVWPLAPLGSNSD